MAKNLSVLEQDIKLQIQEAQKILRKWTQRKPNSEKLYAKWWKLKTKGKKKSLKEPEKNNNSNDCRFLLRNKGGKQEEKQHF